MINVIIVGLPGKMAMVVAKHFLLDARFNVIKKSLTGPGILDKNVRVGGENIELITPGNHKEALVKAQDIFGSFIVIDYTHPSAVNENAELYCELDIPFVMGTTGGDRLKLLEAVARSANCAVIAPNMAKQVVGFQATMKYMSENFPNLFKDYKLRIVDSHQVGKADVSGTASSMVEQEDGSPGIFNLLGVPFKKDQIEIIRDPAIQKSELGIPDEHLSGHGWHTYTLYSKDSTVLFEFTHNVNGRDIYALGTIDAILYLSEKVEQGIKRKVFSMIDVISE